MSDVALSVLEIIAVAVPLIAILVIQLFRTEDLSDRIPPHTLEHVGRLLVATGFLFLLTIAAAILLIFDSELDLIATVTAGSLALGLALLTIVVLVFPMLILALNTDDSQQETLPERTEVPEDAEEDLPSQRREDMVEDATKSER